MSIRREQMYKKLKEQFKALRATLNAHLDVDALADDGIDVSFVDLYQEPQGSYFLPMSQSRLESLDQRPHFDPSFSMEDPQWSYGDALILLSALVNQLIQPHEETLFRGIDVTKWNHKGCVMVGTSPSQQSLTLFST